MVLEIPCDRCREPVRSEIELDFQKDVDLDIEDGKQPEEFDETNYIDGYTEKKQIKILNELNADSFFINKFLDNKFIGDNINNPYNLE